MEKMKFEIHIPTRRGKAQLNGNEVYPRMAQSGRAATETGQQRPPVIERESNCPVLVAALP
jgi:hypothetical protein